MPCAGFKKGIRDSFQLAMMLKIVLAFTLFTLGEISCFFHIGSPGDTCVLSYKVVYISKPGVKQHVEPIIAIHGLAGSYSAWNSIEDDIVSNTGRTMYAPDLRNHGDSCWSNISDTGTMALDIKRFMDKKHIYKANIMGHSLGGKVAVDFALKYPHRTNSLVVEDMRPNGIADGALKEVQLVIQLVGIVFKYIPENVTDAEARQFLINSINAILEQQNITERLDNSSAAALPIRCSDGKCNWTINYDIILDLTRNPDKYLTQSNGRYYGPTLFIYGTESPFKVGDVREDIIEKFPNAQIVPIQGASHTIHGNYLEFNMLVKNLLNKAP